MKDIYESIGIILFVLLDIAMNIALVFAAIVILYYTWPIIVLAIVIIVSWIRVTSKG